MVKEYNELADRYNKLIDDKAELERKMLKAPEEYIEGCEIDEQTNIFTLGAFIFEFFGIFSDEEVYQRYCKNQFTPCSLSKWQLNEESYRVATKAVSLNKKERYLTFSEFWGVMSYNFYIVRAEKSA